MLGNYSFQNKWFLFVKNDKGEEFFLGFLGICYINMFFLVFEENLQYFGVFMNFDYFFDISYVYDVSIRFFKFLI